MARIELQLLLFLTDASNRIEKKPLNYEGQDLLVVYTQSLHTSRQLTFMSVVVIEQLGNKTSDTEDFVFED